MNNIKQTRAIVALAPVVLLGFSLTNAHADVPADTLVMSVYLDTLGADTVLAGDISKAITQIEKHHGWSNTDALAADTNLCVAYTLARRWDDAKSRCDASVTGARMHDADEVYDFGAARTKRMAIAYSNRSVLEGLHDEKQKALADVARARSLAPRLDFVAHNWTALNGGPNTIAGPKVASIRP
jgi:hypothetical protein